ncbi:MAG: cellulose biosynthesis protein BcsS [Alphaproteobacteria bacterium]
MTEFKIKNLVIGASVAFLALASTVPAMAQDAGDKTAYWAGIDFTDDSTFGYAGVAYALHDTLLEDGWLARVGIGYGEYEYNTVAVSGLGVDGDNVRANAMVGYQKHFDTMLVSAFAGIDYNNHDLSPNDPGNDVDGSETGVMAQVEVRKNFDALTQLNLNVNYSTAYNNYYATARLERDLGSFKIGPQVTALGSESFDHKRLGIYVATGDLLPVNLSFQAGQSWASRRGDDSPYIGFGISNTF